MREMYHTSHTSVVPLVVSGEEENTVNELPHFFEVVHPEFEVVSLSPFPLLRPNRSSSL